nr:g-type lectin s-receptor-like serine/threonine-protein kinase [Quercus suber]
MPPKKKARKVRHVDEVTAPEHGHRQRQECERPVIPDGGEIDEVAVADRIYARIARAVQGGERRREDFLFREFRKQNPPTFDGGPNPMAAENWLLNMEKLQRALKCTDAQKVLYATYALQGPADRWWLSTEKLLETELGMDTPITWEKFKEVFDRTYFPDLVRDRKAREFSDLVQGAMTVEEYVAKFVELSRFAPYLIPDESKKVKKFREGLNDRIRPFIIASGVDTFTETVKRAMSLEEDFKCNLGSKNDEKKQEPSGFQHGEDQGKNFMKGFFKKSGNGDHSNGQDKGASPQSSGKKSCSRCDRFYNGYACGGVKLCYYYYGRNPSTRGRRYELDNLGYSRAAEKPVWVANRNNPVLDNSGILTIGNDGHLKILHDGGVEIVLFSAPLVNNASATLRNSGNFVLHELNSNGSRKQVLWQSFDYPTGTLLPGMKIGINTKTGHRWSLTSWSSEGDPAAGSFKLGMDPNHTNQLIIWWQGEISWVSGLWQNSSFNLPHVLSNDVYYHFSYQSEAKEKYFKYFVYKDVISFQRLSLDTSGALWGMTTNEALKIFLKYEQPSFRDRCFGRKYEECFAGKGFTARKGIMLQSGFKFNEGDKLTLNDCKAMCMNYCSCDAYSSTNDDETGCEIWSHDWQNFVKKNSDDYRYIYFRQSPFDFESKGSQVLFLSKPRIWIGIKTLGGLIVLMFRSIYYMTQEKLRSFGKKNREKDILLHELGRRDGKKSHELQFFSFESIAAATNNFTSTSKLGEGGFGSVYKGQLPDGQEISDFGMARIFGSNDSEVNTKRVVGTYDYMSPEYVMEGVFSTKSDIFSFGVLLLEIVSGQKNYSSYHSERPLNLIGYAWELWGEDILVQGQKLREEHLASSGGTFRLEFFSPGSSRNRLTISHSGGSLIASNSVQAANNASAMLLESGNFILREQNIDGSTRKVLWQSFDYPTDALLPGMKLEISVKATDIWSLTSWISENNPAKGTFTVTAGVNMDGKSMLIIWWQGNTYWISGNWQNGHFEFVPRLSNERDISFSYISNENEKYFTYYLNKNRTLSRYMIDFTGAILEMTALAPFGGGPCSYGSYPGCVKQQLPACRKPNDQFEQRKGVMSGEGFKFDGNYNMSLFDCRAKCLNNCSCIAYAATDYNQTSCTIWSKGVNFKESNNSYSLDVHFLVQEKAMWWIWVVLSVTGIVVLLVLCLLYNFIQRKCKEKGERKAEQEILQCELGASTSHASKSRKRKLFEKDRKKSSALEFFSFESIAEATNNFATTSKLGEGGFGPVYKGTFANDQEMNLKQTQRELLEHSMGIVERRKMLRVCRFSIR